MSIVVLLPLHQIAISPTRKRIQRVASARSYSYLIAVSPNFQTDQSNESVQRFIYLWRTKLCSKLETNFIERVAEYAADTVLESDWSEGSD